MFDKFDTNDNGTIEKDELRSFVRGMMGQDDSINSDDENQAVEQ